MSKRWILLIVATLALSWIASAQSDNTRPRSMAVAWTIPVPRWVADAEEEKQDEGYRLYREGYSLLLDERWEAAREKFAQLTTRFPRSSYVDDAKYWSAYALMQVDQKRALEEYRSFVRQFKKSNYLPDAIADLAQLEALLRIRPPRPTAQPPGSLEEGEYSYEVTITPQVRRFKRGFQMNAERWLRIMVAPPQFAIQLNDTTVDREIRIRMQAIAALAETKEDEKSFQTLRGIATDPKQPRPVRLVAMNSLAGLRKHSALPVFAEIARGDTSLDMQVSAISLIRLAAHDRDRTVESLEQIFQTSDPNRQPLLASTLYAIAEVGNDRAVDFLGQIARTHSSDDLRSAAVFYLGNIGSERARAMLLEILQGEGR
jgi:HEAT repeat protein